MILRTRKSCFIIYTILSLCCSLHGNAQQKYQYTVYTQDEGLASGTIRIISQDKSGFLWLMAESGMSRFDGYTFKNFIHEPDDSSSISSSDINRMLVADDGKQYFTTENSVMLYRASTGDFETILAFTEPNEFFDISIIHDELFLFKPGKLTIVNAKSRKAKSLALPPGFERNDNIQVQRDSGRIWLNNDRQVAYFDLTSEKFISCQVSGENNKSRFPAPLAYFYNGSDYCFYSSGEIYIFNKAAQTFNLSRKIDTKDESNAGIKGAIVYKNQSIIIKYSHDKIGLVEIASGSYYTIPLDSDKSNQNSNIEISEAYIGENGRIWVCTPAAGVYCIDVDEKKVVNHLWHNGQNASSLVSNNIEYVYESQGVVWLTTPGIGLVKAEVDKALMAHYHPGNDNSSQPDISTNVRAVLELDENTLLIGTLKGLSQFNKTTHQFSDFISPADGAPLLKNKPISALCKDKNQNIWIAEWFSPLITVINIATGKQYTYRPSEHNSLLKSESVRSLFVDSHNYLWIGTNNNQVCRMQIGNFDFSKPDDFRLQKFYGGVGENGTLNFNIVFTIAEIKNRILIGSSKGLYVYDYATNKISNYPGSANKNEGLNINNVRSICPATNGAIWIGTSGGGMNVTDQSMQQFRYFTVKNGLPDNIVYSTVEDNDGKLWLGTNKGICYFDPEKNYIRNYGMRDGIQNYEFNTNAALRTSEGEIVLAGVGGFNIFHPDSIRQTSYVPPVVISEFKVNDKTYPLSEKIVLAHDQNSISIQFAGLSYFKNKYNLYAYRLDGVNSEWVYCDTRRFSNFAGLPPGEYTFHVKASNYNGDWNNEGAVIHFEITPPFWNTWWFRSILVIVLAGLIYLLFLIRLKQRLRLELIRNKIARDLHDEVGSNLASISLFSEVAREKTNNPQMASIIGKISNYTQTSQDAINDIVWMINTGNDSFERIFARMKKHSSELFEATTTILHMNFDDRLNAMKLQMDNRKNFYLIYKEAVTNIVRHAKARNAGIFVSLVDDNVELSVKDDGTGFDLAAEQTGTGLINMRQRAALIHAELEIKSAPGKGTQIKLTFKATI